MLALHQEPGFSEMFVAYLLARNVRYQQDLVDQLFGSSEKRLAQSLLLQARFGEEGAQETVILSVSHEALADMAGTTQSRVSFFMDRFRRLGFLAYSGSGLRIIILSSTSFSAASFWVPISHAKPQNGGERRPTIRVHYPHIFEPSASSEQ